MLRRRIRLFVLLGVLTLPSCIVITCGETRTFRTQRSETRDTIVSGTTGADTASNRW